jgi:hypothetical protein
MKLGFQSKVAIVAVLISICIASYAGAQITPAAAPKVRLESVRVWVNQQPQYVADGGSINVNMHDIVVVQPKATYTGTSGWGSMWVFQDSVASGGILQVKLLKPGIPTAMQVGMPLYTGSYASDYTDTITTYGGGPGSTGSQLHQFTVNVNVP